jgi:hypothetical protein
VADQRVYNARVTTEALEKKFRDTFPSQAGAELVDDLYASGVIVPTVDFTAAAQGSELRADLQKAWDASTQLKSVYGFTTVLTSTPGFYKVDLICSTNDYARATQQTIASIVINDGVNNIPVWRWDSVGATATSDNTALAEGQFVVFLRSGDELRASAFSTGETLNVWYRQIADVNGNLVNPLGFVFS